MKSVEELMAIQVGANNLYEICKAAMIFIVLLLIFKIFKTVVIANLRKLAKKTHNKFDDELIQIIYAIPFYFYVIISFYFSMKTLHLPDMAGKLIWALFIGVVIFVLVKVVLELIDYGMTKVAAKEGKGEQAKSTFYGLRLVVKIIIWSTAFILFLSNLGVNVTSLVASLGIGGIAVALAVQNILADIFSSFSIYFDKPFVVGDFIQVGTDGGRVKKIGLKTTRLETLQGEELVVSNQELTSARVQNFRRLKKRRGVVNLGVVYSTKVPKLKNINDIVKKVINSVRGAEFDRCYFTSFGDFALNFEAIFYVDSTEYVDFLKAQEKINLGILEEFHKAKIDLAFPTQTVHVQK